MADLEISCNHPLSYVNKSFTQHPVLFLKHIVKAWRAQKVSATFFKGFVVD